MYNSGQFLMRHNYTIITLYILEQPSFWSTSHIRPSWPQSRLELRLLPLSFMSILVCFLPTQYFAVYSNSSCFTLTLPFDMQNGHPAWAAWTLTHGHKAWTCSMNMQHKHEAWTCSMEMSMEMKH
jgi:hypothetical protein